MKPWDIEVRCDKYRSPDDLVEIVHRSRRPGPVGLVAPRVHRSEFRPVVAPFETLVASGNMLVDVGAARLMGLLVGAGGQAYDATHSRVGVGDSTTAAASGQTDLQAAAGAANRQFKVPDATFPSLAGQILTWRITLGATEANFALPVQEWCIDQGTVDGTVVVGPMLNRKVFNFGTKVNPQVWQLTLTLQIS